MKLTPLATIAAIALSPLFFAPKALSQSIPEWWDLIAEARNGDQYFLDPTSFIESTSNNGVFSYAVIKLNAESSTGARGYIFDMAGLCSGNGNRTSLIQGYIVYERGGMSEAQVFNEPLSIPTEGSVTAIAIDRACQYR